MRPDLVLPHRHLSALAALVADVGEPCWVSAPTVCAIHAFDGFDLRPPFHLITARDRNVRRIGHVLHTTHEIPLIDRARKYGLPVLSVTRALIDLARMVGPEALTIALDSAIRDGGTSEDFLHRRINALRASGREGPARMLAVLEGAEITRGGQSWLEREVLRLLDGAGLPKPSTQVVLGRRGDKLIRVDFRFPGTPIVLEALGYRWHRSVRSRTSTLNGRMPCSCKDSPHFNSPSHRSSKAPTRCWQRLSRPSLVMRPKSATSASRRP